MVTKKGNVEFIPLQTSFLNFFKHQMNTKITIFHFNYNIYLYDPLENVFKKINSLHQEFLGQPGLVSQYLTGVDEE